MHYYIFLLNGEEYIYYTSVTHETSLDILEWAERYSFIQEIDIPHCSDARELSSSEVEHRNQLLYKEWYEKHKFDAYLSGKVPPTIGIQLD